MGVKVPINLSDELASKNIIFLSLRKKKKKKNSRRNQANILYIYFFLQFIIEGCRHKQENHFVCLKATFHKKKLRWKDV